MTPETSFLTAHLAELRLRDLAATHIRARQRTIQRLAKHLSRDAATVTESELRSYLAQIPRNTPRSRYAECSHLGSFFRWCVLHAHLPTDPMAKIPRPRLARLLPRPISEADLGVAINNAEGRVRLWLVLAAYEGLRACEVAGLDRADVMDNAPVPVMLVHGKGRKDRIVPLGERALMELRAYGMPSCGPLFPRLDGGPGPTSNHRVSIVANNYLRDMGITDTYHSLRHRFATRTHDASGDLLVVAALLGHEDIRSTTIYTAFSNPQAVAAVRALDAIA